MADDDLRVAVITGNHSFDVPGFHRLFRALPGVDAYIQDLENWVADAGKVRERYDVALFYNMHTTTPDAAQGRAAARTRAALEWLGETAQGIVILHHAVLAFPDWPLWSEICGITDRALASYHHGERLWIEIANPDHPITCGLAPWEIVDETYVMHDADEGNDVLLTVNHPQSARTIGWTRSYRQARVFCCLLGHDDEAYSNPQFRTVLQRGIQWVARRR